MSLKPLPIEYPNLVLAMRIVAGKDEARIALAVSHMAARHRTPEATREPLDLASLFDPTGDGSGEIKGRASDLVWAELDWPCYSLILAAARDDKYMPTITGSIIAKARTARTSGMTVAQFQEGLKRGRQFDEDAQSLFDAAAQRARSSAGKDVA